MPNAEDFSKDELAAIIDMVTAGASAMNDNFIAYYNDFGGKLCQGEVDRAEAMEMLTEVAKRNAALVADISHKAQLLTDRTAGKAS